MKCSASRTDRDKGPALGKIPKLPGLAELVWPA
jgi:hypothetical protein